MKKMKDEASKLVWKLAREAALEVASWPRWKQEAFMKAPEPTHPGEPPDVQERIRRGQERERRLLASFRKSAARAVKEHHEAGRTTYAMVDGKWTAIEPQGREDE